MAQVSVGLNTKQQRFVDEYLVDLNATQAAIRCGYSAKTAKVQGSRLLTNAAVAQSVAERLKTSTEKAHLTIERIDQEIARLAFCDTRKLFYDDGSLKPPSEWDDDTAAAVAGIDVQERKEGSDDEIEVTTRKVKLWDKGNALALAARRLGLLKDKTEVEVTVRLETLIAQSMKPVQEIEG